MLWQMNVRAMSTSFRWTTSYPSGDPSFPSSVGRRGSLASSAQTAAGPLARPDGGVAAGPPRLDADGGHDPFGTDHNPRRWSIRDLERDRPRAKEGRRRVIPGPPHRRPVVLGEARWRVWAGGRSGRCAPVPAPSAMEPDAAPLDPVTLRCRFDATEPYTVGIEEGSGPRRPPHPRPPR